MRTIGLVLLSAAVAGASFEPLWFGDAIARADVIAVGVIASLDGSSYHLQVERAIVGATAGERLKVKRFEDWTCAVREPPYRRGQRILALLRRFDGALARLGGACEGEILIEGRKVRDVSLPVSRDIDEPDLAAAVAEFRDGWRTNDPESWLRLLESERDLVVQTAVDKLSWHSWNGEGPAAPIVDALLPLLAHRDEFVRLTLAEGLRRMVGAERAKGIAGSLRAMGGRGGLAPALALCHLDPTHAQALGRLLALLGDAKHSPDELRAIQRLLCDAPTLRGDRRQLYPVCRALLEKELSRALAHPLLIALRRWHGEPAPLPYEEMEAARRAWLARLDADR